jgi:hypothetical protein
VHSADAVLLAATDAVAKATTNLMGDKEPDLAQPQLRDQGRGGSVVWDEFTSADWIMDAGPITPVGLRAIFGLIRYRSADLS